MKVISFCIYGSNDKYCKGLDENLKLIQNNLSDYNAFIYIGDNVPEYWIEKYKSYQFVKLIETNRIGHDNRINRFFAIDDPKVEIAHSRDTDSRLHERDIWCIKEFEKSQYLFYAIRDHPAHGTPILAGLWGIKKRLINRPIKELYLEYNISNKIINKTQHDQDFLRDVIYLNICSIMIIYVFNKQMKMRYDENIFEIPFTVINDDFCGLVIDYDSDGNEIKPFKWC
jgi:hypothetical protein